MFTGRGTRGGTRGGRDQFNWEDVRGMDADRTHYLGASVKARKVQHPPTPRRFPPWQRSRRALRGLSARLRPRAGQEQREAWARGGGRGGGKKNTVANRDTDVASALLDGHRAWHTF